MDTEAALQFLRANHRAVMLTFRRDGSPQLSPVVHAVDDEGHLLVSTRETAMKAKNLARDPRIAICGLNDGFFGQWIQVTGTAELLHLPEAMPVLEDVYRRIAGEHPDWDDYRAAMGREQRLVVRMTIERAGPTVSG